MKKLLIFVCCGMGCGLNGMNMDHFLYNNIGNTFQDVDNPQQKDPWLESLTEIPTFDLLCLPNIQSNRQGDEIFEYQDEKGIWRLGWNPGESSQKNIEQNINNKIMAQENIPQDINNINRVEVKRYKFTPDDIRLIGTYIAVNGTDNLNKLAPILNCSERLLRDFVKNNMAELSNVVWNSENDQKLRQLVQKYGPHVKLIAKLMNRSEVSVWNRIKYSIFPINLPQ